MEMRSSKQHHDSEALTPEDLHWDLVPAAPVFYVGLSSSYRCADPPVSEVASVAVFFSLWRLQSYMLPNHATMYLCEPRSGSLWFLSCHDDSATC